MDAELLLQLADGILALDQRAGEHQARRMGQRLEEGCDFSGPRLHLGRRQAVSAWTFTSISSPCCPLQRIERELQVAPAIGFRLRQPAAADIDLQGMQDQLRHRQRSVASLAQRDEGSSQCRRDAGSCASVRRPCFPSRVRARPAR